MTRISISPALLQWACERSDDTREDLEKRFEDLRGWEAGTIKPTLNQLENFAKAVHVPIGYLFLSEPPEESLPISDFRTFAGKQVTYPSRNLLAMIYACQRRQDWYQDFARANGEPEISFIGSANVNTSPETVASAMREALHIDVATFHECKDQSNALKLLIHQAEEAGVLVMVSSIVMNNTSRSLDLQEFRGFALSDPFAPLVFINSKDTKAAQMFTLAHELAHLWLGDSSVSNIIIKPGSKSQREETWCNTVAAEFLVPLDTLRSELRADEHLDDTLRRLAKKFKVSTLVILLRLLKAEQISQSDFDIKWKEETERLRNILQRKKKSGGGGDPYAAMLSRVGHRFINALVVSTFEGRTLYRDAFRLLGISKAETFDNLVRDIGSKK